MQRKGCELAALPASCSAHIACVRPPILNPRSDSPLPYPGHHTLQVVEIEVDRPEGASAAKTVSVCPGLR